MRAASPGSAIVVAGHGSRDTDGIREFESLVALLKRRVPERIVAHGYLEFATPTIDDAVRAALEAGAQGVALVPGVLFAARHAKNDLPSELLALQHEFPDRPLVFGAPLGLHPKLLQLAQQRIVAAEATSPRVLNRADSCLVLVGRGTTDPDANSEVCKLARMLEEGMGFGGSFVCYSGTAKPPVADGLRSVARLGFSRLVVLPYFLFDGVLVKRIYAAADALAQRESVEVLKADYLGVHEAVAD